MNKCKNCGTFVPAEKAFCPNCGDPMEEEDKGDRATSFDSGMMATIRDDPENYRQLLEAARQKAAKPKAATPASAPTPSPSPSPSPSLPPTPPPTPPPAPPPVAPPVINYNTPQPAYAPAPAVKNNRRPLFIGLGTVAFLVLVFVLLVLFKVIDIGLFNQ